MHDRFAATPLILDSGVRSSILDRDFIQHQTLSSGFQIQHETAYGLLKRVSLGRANFYDIGAFATEFSAPGQPLHCLSEGGALGSGLMRHATWQTDYQRRRLTIADSIEDLEHVAGAIALPFTLVNASPAIALRVGSQSVKVLIDTGWNGSIYLADQDVAQLDTKSFRPLSTAEGLIETLQGMQHIRQTVQQVPVLSVGELTMAQFPVTVSKGNPAQPASLMGNGFLEHFIVTLDWQHQRLYLKQVAPIEALYPRPMAYGFHAIVHHRHLLITGLSYPSPATEAGLQVGDQVLSINRDAYTYIKAGEACNFVRAPLGDRYVGPLTMTVARNGRSLTYAIAPRR